MDLFRRRKEWVFTELFGALWRSLEISENGCQRDLLEICAQRMVEGAKGLLNWLRLSTWQPAEKSGSWAAHHRLFFDRRQFAARSFSHWSFVKNFRLTKFGDVCNDCNPFVWCPANESGRWSPAGHNIHFWMRELLMSACFSQTFCSSWFVLSCQQKISLHVWSTL